MTILLIIIVDVVVVNYQKCYNHDDPWRRDDVNYITLDLHLWTAIKHISCWHGNLEDKKPLEDNFAEDPHPQAVIRLFSESVYIRDCF